METKLSLIKNYVLGIGMPILFIIVVWWAYKTVWPDLAPIANIVTQGWKGEDEETEDDVHLTRLFILMGVSFILLFISPGCVISLWALIVLCVAIWSWPFTFKELEIGGFLLIGIILVFGSALKGIFNK